VERHVEIPKYFLFLQRPAKNMFHKGQFCPVKTQSYLLVQKLQFGSREGL